MRPPSVIAADERRLCFDGRMGDLLEWIGDYPTGVVVLIALCAALLYLVKLIVERGVTAGFDQRAKVWETRVERRSAFEEKVLLNRFELVSAFSARLERIMTDLNRMRSGKEPSTKNFLVDDELVPLTEVFEDLQVHRLVLGERFYPILDGMAQLAMRSRTVDDAALRTEWENARTALRDAGEDTFGISQITF